MSADAVMSALLHMAREGFQPVEMVLPRHTYFRVAYEAKAFDERATPRFVDLGLRLSTLMSHTDVTNAMKDRYREARLPESFKLAGPSGYVLIRAEPEKP